MSRARTASTVVLLSFFALFTVWMMMMMMSFGGGCGVVCRQVFFLIFISNRFFSNKKTFACLFLIWRQSLEFDKKNILSPRKKNQPSNPIRLCYFGCRSRCVVGADFKHWVVMVVALVERMLLISFVEVDCIYRCRLKANGKELHF